MDANDEVMQPPVSDLDSHTAPSPFTTVTTVSKLLALALFVALPFIGGYVGYTYAPEKVVEVERVVIKEVKDDAEPQVRQPIKSEKSEFQATEKSGLTAQWFADRTDGDITYRPDQDTLAVTSLGPDTPYSLVTIANTMPYATILYDEEKQVPVRIAPEYKLGVLRESIGGTVFVQNTGQEIQQFDVLTGEIEVLYREGEPDVQLVEYWEMGMAGIFYVTNDGVVVFSRHKKLPGTTLTEFLEIKTVNANL